VTLCDAEVLLFKKTGPKLRPRITCQYRYQPHSIDLIVRSCEHQTQTLAFIAYNHRIRAMHAIVTYLGCIQSSQTLVVYNHHIGTRHVSSHTLVAYNHHMPWLHTVNAYALCIQSSHTLVAYDHHIPWLHTIITYLGCIRSSQTLVVYDHHKPWLHTIIGMLRTGYKHQIPWLHTINAYALCIQSSHSLVAYNHFIPSFTTHEFITLHYFIMKIFI
jgi:hypothetical protein